MAAVVFAVADDTAVGPDSNPVKYYGYSLRETGSLAAVYRIRSASATGEILDTISFAADESKAKWYGPDAIIAIGPIFIEQVTGAVEGTVRIG